MKLWFKSLFFISRTFCYLNNNNFTNWHFQIKFLSRVIFTLKADSRQQRLTCLVCSLRPSFLTKTEAFSLFPDFLTASPFSLTFCRNKSTPGRLCCPSSRFQNSASSFLESDEDCLSSSQNSAHVELVKNSPPASVIATKAFSIYTKRYLYVGRSWSTL